MPPYNENPCRHNFGFSPDVHCFTKYNKRIEIDGYPKWVRGKCGRGLRMEGD